MDSTVRLLVRCVSRSFYGKPYVLILDAILLHSVLSEDDLSHLLGIQKKELRSLCNRLVDDRLLVSHVQREAGLNGNRPTSKTYYFIHHTEAIDGIKWKVQQVVQGVKVELNADASPQGYICPVCKTKYSQLDAVALLNFEKNDFVCSLCNEILIEDDSGKIAKENQKKYSELMKQLEPMINYLRKIDEHTIPENNFETSLEKMIPAQASTNASYTVSSLNQNTKMFDRNSYLNNKSSMVAGTRSQATLHVNISSGDGDSSRSQTAVDQDEKRKQNALPSWHEQSTIGKASLGRLDKEDGDIGDVKMEDVADDDKMNISDLKTEPTDDSTNDVTMNQTGTTAATATTSNGEVDKEAQEALAAYYAQLDRKAQKMREEDDDELDEDDEEDFNEEDFEDVESSLQQETKKDDQSAKDDMIIEELEFSDED